MNRCLLSFLVTAPLWLAPLAVVAQTTVPPLPTRVPIAQPGYRNFPAHAQMGVLRIAQIPNAQINGKAIRTAPGFRLFTADNQLIFGHSVLNQDLKVVYIKEASTDWLLTAWILSPEELTQLSLKR